MFERKACLFCKKNDFITYFNKDYENYIAHYAVDRSDETEIKYLGDLNIIYKYNHADSTGNVMQNLHQEILNLIKKYIFSINNFVEIGSSYGVLSDKILNEFSNQKYYIIEPSYKGTYNDNKIIYNDIFIKIS